MEVDHWDRVQDLFEQALALDVEQRSVFLAEACAGDAELRREIESLLAHHDEQNGLLDAPIVEFPLREMSGEPVDQLIGQKIGGCVLKSVLGSGGMSTVFLALQEKPRREVAVKFMKTGIASRTAMRRFEFESDILARLKHPNIAQVYEVGTHDDGTGGIPYFMMEYIAGATPITEYADGEKLSVRQRMDLFIKVCDAVHHGHQKGIIHRDLKPGNILVDAEGEPKIIDFGVARATDSDSAATTVQTGVGQLIGTLQYMSPEQYAGDPKDLDTRSDVYALGVVLYELLCHQPPYDVARKNVLEAARMIREDSPARPSTVDRTLRRDLETIALKALEKDRARRYQSAAELARDIQRYLNNEPIEARPPSVIYQVRVFARRNKIVVGAAASLLLVLLVGTIVSASFALRLNEATKLPRAIQAFLSNHPRDWSTSFGFARLAAKSPLEGAINVQVRDVYEKDTTSRHAEIATFTDDGKLVNQKILTIGQSPWSNERTSQELASPAHGAAFVDVLESNPGPEIVVAQIDPDSSSSALCIYDAEPRLLAQVWNNGHIMSLDWNEEDRLFLIVACSDDLPNHVPALRESSRLRVIEEKHIQALFAFRAQDIPKEGGMIYPMEGTEELPAMPLQWMITRSMPTSGVDAQLEAKRAIRLKRCSEPDRSWRDAVCKLTIVTYPVHEVGVIHSEDFKYYHAHVGSNGDVLEPFVDDQGRLFTEVTGVPEPGFIKVDLSTTNEPVDDSRSSSN